MPQVVFLPDGVKVNAKAGKSLLDLAFENDIVIEHNCGGLCACTSCRVIIKEGSTFIQNKSEEENLLLSEAGFSGDKNRLGCCCKILVEGNEIIIVEIPQT